MNLTELGFSPVDEFGCSILNVKEYSITHSLTLFNGIRLKIGLKNEYTYELDWCLGDNPSMVEPIVKILVQFIANKQLQLLPTTSLVKPIFKDLQFLKQLTDLGIIL